MEVGSAKEGETQAYKSSSKEVNEEDEDQHKEEKEGVAA